VDAGPRGSRFYGESVKKLKKSVAVLNKQEGLSFVVHLGDAIDRDDKSFDAVMPEFARLKKPCYQVLGNHDFDVAEADKEKVPGRLGLTKRYHDFAVGQLRFVVLDGTDLSVYRDGDVGEARKVLASLQAEGRAYAQSWNGGLGKEQLAWFENVLKRAGQAKEEVIVFCHYPVYPDNAHNLWTSVEVLGLIKKHGGVRAWFNGHNHAGNYGQTAGTHFLTARGMVETKETSAWAVVAVYPDRLEVDGFDREEDRVLRL
ncbi:MAG: metallophosphoesterase, partial [Verrucomicrobiota bacterium]